MNDWKNKIAMILQHFNCTKSELEAKTGVKNGYIRDIETGRNKNPSKFIKGLVDYYGINPNWIMGNDSNMLLSDIENAEENPLLREFNNAVEQTIAPKFAEQNKRFEKIENRQQAIEEELQKLIQLYSPENMKKPENPRKSIIRTMGSTGEVHERLAYYGTDGEEEETEDLPLAENLAAGFPIEAFDNYETYPVPKRFLKKRHKYCVAKIKGTSMTAAGIADGSHVLLEYCNSPVNGSIMVVKYGENTTLKRLHQTDEGEWQLLFEDGSGAIIPLKDGNWEAKAMFITVL